MMNYLFLCIGAALQILFAYFFFATFLETKCEKETILLLLPAAWLLNIAYGLIGIGGVYAYLAYVLMCVLMLLGVFGEPDGRTLGLLALALVIPVAVDGAAQQLAAQLSAVFSTIIMLIGKLIPILLVLLIRRVRSARTVQRRVPQEHDTLLLRQHMELQRESIRALEQNYRLQRKNTHEFEHHLQVLRDLLAQGETTAAQDYLNRLRKNRAIHLMSVNSHHPVIDVILNQKHQTAQENGIKVQIRVNDLSAVDIPTDSLVVVLTNLLDNAIEACRRIDGYREIRCSILYEDGLYISIRNTSAPVEIVDGKIPTSKQDSLSHGFGLMSVGYVLDKLNAEYTFGYDEGWFHFAAEIE